MPRLVVNPGSSNSWEIKLKPGTNTIGRDDANDFTVADPSVSSHHCQIKVDNGQVIIHDVGSTNGTFVERTPIQEAALQSGHTVHLGNVKMVFYADQPALVIAHKTATSAPAIATPSGPTGASSLSGAETGPHECKFHPRVPGRYYCPQCQHYFCDFCVTVRAGKGGQRRFCRHCGSECVGIQVELKRPQPKGFFQRLPGAFAYPIRGGGAMIIILGIFILTGLNLGRGMMLVGSVRALIFGVILQIVAGGYLFTYLQSIIHSTAAEDREMPDLPGLSNFLEDVLLPFFRLLGLVLISFGPAIVVGIWAATSRQPAGPVAVLVASILGAIYFPMGFLAVAILDNVTAANPLLVVPSMFRVPVEYVISLVFLGFALGFRIVANYAIKSAFPEGFTTHSMGQLFAMLGTQALLAFASFYLITVTMHVLGLLYLTCKERLGWLNR